MAGFYPDYNQEPHCAFISAARYNDVETIQFLGSLDFSSTTIMSVLSLSIQEEAGAKDTALIAAARNEYIEAVDAILNLPSITPMQRGTLLEAKNTRNETALMVAIKSGNVQLVHKMLFGLEVNQEIEFVNRACDLAQEANMDGMMAMLEIKRSLNQYKKALIIEPMSPQDSYVFLKQTNHEAQTVVMQAVDAGDIDMIFSLLENMKKLSCEQRFELLMPALQLAIKDRSAAIVKMLFDSCLDLSIDQRRDNLYTPDLREALVIAARDGSVEIVKILLESPVLKPEFIIHFLNEMNENIGAEDTALMAAARNGHIKVIQAIFNASNFNIQQNAALLNRANAQGETVFIIAARNNQGALLGALFQYGDTDLLLDVLMHKDKQKKTAWMHAKENEYEEISESFCSAFVQAVHLYLNKNNNSAVQILLESIDPATKFFALSTVRCKRGMTFLMRAVLKNNVLIVKKILLDLPFREKLILLNQHYGDKKAITFSQEEGYEEISEYLADEIQACISSIDESGEKLFLKAAREGDVELVERVIDSVNDISPDDKHKWCNLATLFLQRNSDGNAALMCAIENEDEAMVHTLFSIFEKIISEIIYSPFIENEKKSILIVDLLRSIPVDMKFQLLQNKNDQGAHFIMHPIFFGFTRIVRVMLEDLDIDQLGTILNQKMSDGQTALSYAKELRFQAIVELLENLSLRLAFNTHSATVHDSVARSVIALSAHYLELSQDDKATLQSWADSVPGDSNDGVKREAMLQVIHKNETQFEFAKLTQYCEAQMTLWVSQRNASVELMHQAAARGIHLIQDNQSYRNYLEPRIEVSLMQILALTWIAIEDQRECDSNTELTEQLNDRKIALIDALFQAQRDRNLTNGKDLDPSSADQPKCQGGFINNLMNALIGLHSQVKVVVVNKETVKLKAMCLVGSLFNSTDYTVEQVREIESTLEEDSCLTPYVQENLKPKIEGALHTEFDDFVETKFLHVEDIPAITGAVLSFQSPNSYTTVQVIQAKLANDLRMHPKPEAQPDDEQSEQINKRPRLG